MAKKKSPKKKSDAVKLQAIQDAMKNQQEQLGQEPDQDDTQGQHATTEEGDDGSVVVHLHDGDDEVQGGLGQFDLKSDHYGNLVHLLDDEQKHKLGALVLTGVNSDEASRSEWMRTIKFGLDLTGTKIEEKNTPFQGACSAQHPLLMESAVKFQSKASNELLPAKGPVRVSILGDCTPEKEEQANRVKDHMNYQITEEMTEFYTDSERMLLYVALVGSGFKKTYYNAHLERPCSEFVPADQFIVPNSASDLYRADRYTHILYKTDYELNADCEAGLYEMPEDGLGTPATPKLTDVAKKTQEMMGITIGIGERDKVYTLYEQHIMLNIEGLDDDEEGYDQKKYKLASPYILTIDAASSKLIGLRRNWKKGDKKRKKKVQFSHFCFVPSFNFYGYGYLHLLGNLQLSLTASLRSLVDAGQFATLQGGFKLKGVRIVDDGSPIHPGQFKEIECAVQDINKAIMNLPFKEPSNVLFQMLEFLDQKGHAFADASDAVVADSANYGPVGTTMALLEASTKFFSAIHKRLHAALKNELKMIAEINAETLPDNLEYNVENQTMQITREDYSDTMSVMPVSDPNISSSAHRMAKAQALLTMAQQAPGMHDMREIYRHVYINMDYEHIEKILPLPAEAQPQDPISDLQAVVAGKPIKAFPGQDHKAHIAIKQAFMQDPMSGQNPMMQKTSVAVQANVQEHMMLQFVEQVQAAAAQAQSQQPGAQPNVGQAQTAPQAPAQAPDPMVQAAQQVAQLNLQLIQQQAQPKPQPRDQAALMLAQAETQDTATKAKAQEFDMYHKTAALDLKKQELDIKKAEVVHKVLNADHVRQHEMDKIVTTKGLDAMIEAMSQGHQAQTQHSLGHQKILGAIATMPPPVPPKEST